MSRDGLHALNKDELILLISRMSEIYRPRVECSIEWVIVDGRVYHDPAKMIPLLTDLDVQSCAGVHIRLQTRIITTSVTISLSVIGRRDKHGVGELSNLNDGCIQTHMEFHDIIVAFIKTLPQWEQFSWRTHAS